jgi:hypothetical protein
MQGNTISSARSVSYRASGAKEANMSKRLGNNEARTTGTLLQRSRRIIELFDAETKDYAFGDGGDAEMYAAEMADLLERWADVSRPGYHGPDVHSPIEHIYLPPTGKS